LARCWRTRCSPANWHTPTRRLTVTPAGGRTSARVTTGISAVDRRTGDRGELRALGPRSGDSTTYSLSTNARTIEVMLARRRAGGASSSATSKDTLGGRARYGDRAGRTARTSRRDRQAREPVDVRQSTVVRQADRRLRNGILGIYESASRRLTYASAGHPPPLLRRAADRSISALDAVGSCPLGIDDSETFQEASVQLERDDTLLLYTDGSPRREAWRKHYLALTGSRTCFATEATDL